MLVRILSAIRALLRRARFERDLSRELEIHIELCAEDLMKRGMSREGALRRARAEFGSIDAAKEGCREEVGASWMDGAGRDLRLAFRLVRKNPGFTFVVTAILAFSIGANVAIFSVVDAVLLRGVPYPDADRLAQIVTTILREGEVWYEREAQDGTTWEAVRDDMAFIERAVYSAGSTGVNLVSDNGARYVRRGRVSSGFFSVLGVAPAIGREFTSLEDRPGGPAVALLSHELFRSAFHGDPAVVGKAITLRGEAHLVVGVMPEGFESHVPAGVWTPLRATASGEGVGTNYSVIARIPPDLSWREAETRVRTAGGRATAHLSAQDGVSAEVRLVPLDRALSRYTRLSLTVALGSVLVILLIGCANVSGLMMARASRRTHEVATRMLLGGGRAVIVRQLLTEALLLSAVGGLVGVALGFVLVELAGSHVRASLGMWQAVRIDARVLAAAILLALTSSVVFGLVPALQSGRVGLRHAMSVEGTRSVAGGRSRMPRHALVFAQVALTFVLLVGAGLLLRTLQSLNALAPGFERRNLLTASVSLDDERYRSRTSVSRLFARSLERIRALDDVESAAVGLTIPFERALNAPFGLEGETELTTLIYVSPGYFETLRMALLQGRSIDEHDAEGGRSVVVVSRGFAERFFPGGEALGRHIELMDAPREIVGIVGDVQQTGQLGFGPIGPVPAAYVPVTQFDAALLAQAHTWFTPSFVVRAASDRGQVAENMKEALASVDPLLPFAGFTEFDAMRRRALAQERFRTALLSALAGLALFLAATGTSGLIAQSVAERRRELGIRLALGASLFRAIEEAVRPGLLVAASGVFVGGLLSVLAAPVLESFLWEVRPTDGRTFVLAAFGLIIVAAVASLVPALAIAKLDPARTLRAD